MPRRMGRPGLMGTMARTAVVAGTATAVVGRSQKKQANNAAQQQQAAAGQQQAAPVAAVASDDPMAQLERLADMKAKGLLSDAEFTSAKAKLLA